MLTAKIRWQAILLRFRADLSSDRLFYLAVFAFVMLSLAYLMATGHFHGADVGDTLWAYAQLWVFDNGIVFPLLFILIGCGRITLRLNQRRALAYRHMFGAERISRFLAGIVMMVGFLPFRTMFNSLKNVIPDGQGFVDDRLLADLDQACISAGRPGSGSTS